MIGAMKAMALQVGSHQNYILRVRRQRTFMIQRTTKVIPELSLLEILLRILIRNLILLLLLKENRRTQKLKPIKK